jgi:hypothetical protein
MMMMMMTTITIITIIIMYSNDSFNGKCMSIVGPKLTRPPRDPYYWGPDYRKTTLFIIFTLCNI